MCSAVTSIQTGFYAIWYSTIRHFIHKIIPCINKRPSREIKNTKRHNWQLQIHIPSFRPKLLLKYHSENDMQRVLDTVDGCCTKWRLGIISQVSNVTQFRKIDLNKATLTFILKKIIWNTRLLAYIFKRILTNNAILKWKLKT